METVSGREFVFVAWQSISQPLQLTLFPGRRHEKRLRRSTLRKLYKKSLKAQPLHNLLEEQVNDNTFAALHRFVQLRKHCHCHMFRRSMLVERYWR